MKTKISILTAILLNIFLSSYAQKLFNNVSIPQHIESKDFPVIDAAFLHGYVHNIVNENVNGIQIPTLSIQCTDNNVHQIEGANANGRTQFSVWTRDLYWGFLGWSQACDDKVLPMMKSSLDLLIKAKNKNQALGKSNISNMWPLNDKRFYIPQAYTTGLVPVMDLFPWCSESQVDFLLLAYNYYELSGDKAFIASIWKDIEYVTETLELLDSNGNSLPDALWGSYDYMFISSDTEEPLMCAKTSLAYSSVAKLAQVLRKDKYAQRLEKLAITVKETMNKPVEQGGLWKNEATGGYFVQSRNIAKGKEGTNDDFIPYNNLVPMWCGMTNSKQDIAIFRKLDDNFTNIYDLAYGPMYCAKAGHHETSVMPNSSVTWLAFLDVYLRGKKSIESNRTKIYELLMKNVGVAGGIPFSEGAGVYGDLTGGAGRTWDNGNFFHMLVCGVYGLEKSKDGINISSPNVIDNHPISELNNFNWRNAIYNFKWIGKGKNIKKVIIDGNTIAAGVDGFRLTEKTGTHMVEIHMSE